MCKTPRCETLHVMEFAAPGKRAELTPASILPHFDYDCKRCCQTHHYTREDVKLNYVESPSSESGV